MTGPFALLVAHCAKLGHDEIAVLERVAERLVMGRRQYGDLNIASDSRAWDEEARQEILDGLVYLAVGSLKMERTP